MRIRTITPEEAAEFRGLFFGEGHIDLMKNGRADSLQVRLRIAVRDDDVAVLEWVKDGFGGWLCRDSRTRSVCWSLTGALLVEVAIDVLSSGSIPSKKRAEVTLAQEALSLRSRRGVLMPEPNKARLRAIREELKEIRAYKQAVA